MILYDSISLKNFYVIYIFVHSGHELMTKTFEYISNEYIYRQHIQFSGKLFKLPPVATTYYVKSYILFGRFE